MRHPLSLFVIALMTATTVVMGAVIWANTPPVQAQFGPDPETVALQVYERLPDFPRENQYVHRKRKQVVETNTLISRLIQYHTYNQGRSPQYRLDWKITLADYLGLNEYIAPESYPGATFLKDNPFEQDQAIIQDLDRDERNILIQAIVDLYASDESPQRPEVKRNISPSSPSALPSERATDLLLTPPTPVEPVAVPSGPSRVLQIDETP